MNILIAFIFALLAFVLLGLFSISNYRNQNQASRYWGRAVLMDVGGLLFLGVVFFSGLALDSLPVWVRVFGITSNTLLVGSLLFQALSIRCLASDVSNRYGQLVWVLIGVFAISWTYFAGKINVNQRILVFAVIALGVIIWQILMLRRHINLGLNSRQIKFLLYSISGELGFTLIRIYSVIELPIPIVNANSLPILGLIAVFLQYALKIISYASMLGYWSEKLAMEKSKSDFEAEQFKLLSQKQEQLILDLGKINKASTTGILAASIAHELSQPLQSILINNEFSIKQLDKDQPDLLKLRKVLEEQEFNVKRMSQVMTTLRGLFVDSENSGDQVDLHSLIKRLDLLIDPEAKKHSIKFEVAGDLNLIAKANPNEIQQVILNLVSNSIQALVQSNSKDPKILITLRSEGNWAVMEVDDNGPGMPQDQIENVFTFLKTTKASGMGLGLWISKYIVIRNHGEITAGRSSLGGAKFTVKLRAN